jgi:L-threonylcarbamoyladenylate synthase
LETTVVMLRQTDDDAVAETAAALRAGAVVVVPTDTVYGLAALPTQTDAVQAIYAIKERPEGMHLPVLGASLAQVSGLGVQLTAASEALAERWWPGPLTMVFGFAPPAGRPPWLLGRDEVAVRVPRHDFLLALMATTGVLVVTSANPHGAATPPGAAGVAEVFGDRVDLVVDGGPLHGAPSTLVNVRLGRGGIEREGAISATAISSVLAGAGGGGGGGGAP